MKKVNKNKGLYNIPLPEPSSSDLRGRQSVRATFKLSEKAIDALSILSIHLGIKQKSLFDHLIDDTKTLNFIAKEVRSEKLLLPNRIQKTYVLSRRTLSCLDSTCKNFGTPRDTLVEYSIQRLIPLIEQEREKHRKRQEILKELSEYMKQGEKMLKKTGELLGEDDPVYGRLKSAMAVLFNAHSHIESSVEKGQKIEDF